MEAYINGNQLSKSRSSHITPSSSTKRNPKRFIGWIA
jgi:hypothetical protein